jgi:hypothetical protein
MFRRGAFTPQKNSKAHTVDVSDKLINFLQGLLTMERIPRMPIAVDIYSHWMKTKPNTGINFLGAPKLNLIRTHEIDKAITI